MIEPTPRRLEGPVERCLFGTLLALSVALVFPWRLAEAPGGLPVVVTPALLLMGPLAILLGASFVLQPRRWRGLLRADVVLLFAMLAISVLTASMALVDRGVAFRQVFKLGAAIAVYLAVGLTVRDGRRARWLTLALFSPALVLASLGIAERLLPRRPLGFLEWFGPRTGFLPEAQVIRAQATLSYPNALAQVLEVAAVLAVGWWATETVRGGPSRGRDVSTPLVLGVLASGLAFTYSRAGLFGIAGGLALLLVGTLAARVPRPAAARVVGGTAAVAIVLTGVGLTDAALRSRVDRLADSEYGPNQERGHVLESALSTLARRPFLGVGPDNFRLVYRDAYDRDAPYSTLREVEGMPTHHAHSLYLETALDLGVVGLGLFLAWLGVIASKVWCAARCQAPPAHRMAVLALAAAASTYLIHGLGDFLLRSPEALLGFLTVFGLVAAMAEFTLEASRGNPSR